MRRHLVRPIESRAMDIFLTAFITSIIATLLLVRRARNGGHRLKDHDLSGPQKFHSAPVPRVGGLGILFGVLAALLVMLLRHPDIAGKAVLLLLCAVPAFGSGLTEDLTKTQSPQRRLFFTALSAGLAVVAVDGVIARTDVPGLDWVVSFPICAAALTIFMVAGLANSVNIIDGFNGLASMCCVLMLISIGYVAFHVGDTLVLALSVAGAGAVLGFFVWNFPAGLIFLGDGGAYFLGFYVAELAILLLHRNPSVSPMFPVLACIYPLFETAFSIYRRVMLRKLSAGMPDGIHLHSLIYRRIMRWAVGRQSRRSQTRRNSMTSPYLWLLCMMAVLPAMLFWDNTPVLLACIGVFSLTYITLYWRIVRFKVPRWMITKR